jgi:hypothetical protein
MKSERTNKTSLGVISFVYLAILFTLYSPLQAKGQSITWTPGKIDQSIALGERKDLTVSLTSSGNLDNAHLWVVPELQPYMTVDPALLGSIIANTPQRVTLHLFAPPNSKIGTYDGTVHLRVGSKTYPQQLKVKLQIISVNHPPVAQNQSVTTDEGLAKAITLVATDADNDPLTYAIVAQPGHGTLNGTLPNVTYAPATQYYGSDSFTFKANDGKMDSNTATVSITVNHINHPPVAQSQSVTTDEGVAKAITLVATDVDNDPLTYAIVAQPGHGTLSGTLPNVTYAPATQYYGSDSFTFKANDGKMDSNTATVSITVNHINHPPVAQNQSVATDEGVAKAITLVATDADNDPLTYAIVTQPGHGTLSGALQNVTYTPASQYYGSDSFTFKANDGKVDSNTATVSITVNRTNRPPVANAGPDQTVVQGNTVTLDGSGSSDPDNDPLTYQWSLVLPGGNTASLSNSTAVKPTFVVDKPGTYVAQLIVNDGKEGSSPDTVTIQTISNIMVTPASVRLDEAGSNAQLKLTGKLPDGAEVDITSPSFGTFYSSLNSEVATVSPAGLVTAVANGNTNIIVTNGSFGANVPVTVQITQSTRTVGQEGGTLQFHNGLVLEVPPGAVPGPTPIVIKDLPLDQVAAILANPLLTSNRTKRLLGGFSAEPDGLVFNIPVMATIPVLPLNPREIPAQIEIFLNEQRYRYVTSQFVYLGDQGLAKVSIRHFSAEAMLGLTGPEFEAMCTVCPANNAPFLPECNVDPLQLPCCNLYPQVRATCPQASGCHCCREGTVEVEEVSVDFATEFCQMLGSKLKVTFVDCGGQVEDYSTGESACKDLDVQITIEPSPWTLPVGQEKDFHAFVTGTWKAGPLQGKLAFSHASIDPMWESDSTSIANFLSDPNGNPNNILHAYKSTLEPITIRAIVSDDLPKGTAQVTVPGDYIEVLPGDVTECPGKQITFAARLMNSTGEEEGSGAINVEWSIEVVDSSSGAPIASCTANPCPPGSEVSITTGPGEGTAKITAHNVEHDLSRFVYLDVHSGIPVIGITFYKNGGRAYVTGVNLVGTIEECGTRRVKFIQVTNGSDISLLRPVGDNGEFSVMINLNWGDNYLTITTYDANNGRVPNNMDGHYFKLTRLPHCVKSDNTLQLPTVLYETPVTWQSAKPEIASVDPVTGIVTGHANGWAKITAQWFGYTLVRWVGVSTGTNYVATHHDDPFYKPEHVPPVPLQSPFGPGWLIATDLNNKYFVGYYELFIAECQPGWSHNDIGFLYDGLSFQNIILPTAFPGFCGSNVVPRAVNERGQAVGYIRFLDAYGGVTSDVGFMYDQGAISLIADPDVYFTNPSDINNLGKLVGSSFTGAGGGWGFIYDIVSRTFTYIASYPMYINDSGQVLGYTESANGLISLWLYKDGVYEPVAGPAHIVGDFQLHESGQVYVTYENGNSVLLTRCAP